MQQPPSIPYKVLFFISLAALIALSIFMAYSSSAPSRALADVQKKSALQRDSIHTLRQVMRANKLLLMGEYDSAMAIYAQYDTIDWIQQISKSRLALVDSLQKEKVVVKEIVMVPVVEERSSRSVVPPELEDQLNYLSQEVEKTREQRDSLELNSRREREALAKQLEDLQQNGEWKYLKFYKKQKSAYVNYVGQLSNGQANGRGIGLYSTGSVYRGEWRNNERHGKGVFEWSDGEKYEGEYKNDLRDGYGVYYWSNGLRYEGEWRNDKREGRGILFDKKGDIVASGEWKNDKVNKKQDNERGR